MVLTAYINVLHVAMALTLLLLFCLSLAALADASARPGRDWLLAGLSKPRWCALLAASVVPVLGWPLLVLYLRRVRPKLQRFEM
jgi:hypothetical protein